MAAVQGVRSSGVFNSLSYGPPGSPALVSLPSMPVDFVETIKSGDAEKTKQQIVADIGDRIQANATEKRWELNAFKIIGNRSFTKVVTDPVKARKEIENYFREGLEKIFDDDTVNTILDAALVGWQGGAFAVLAVEIHNYHYRSEIYKPKVAMSACGISNLI